MTILNRNAVQELIIGDQMWLLSHPRTLERDHIAQILHSYMLMHDVIRAAQAAVENGTSTYALRQAVKSLGDY